MKAMFHLLCVSTFLMVAANASLAANTFRAAVSGSPVRSGIVSVMAADFNGDGIPDVATADAAGISVGALSLAFSNARALTAADFNGDGRVDLAAVSSEGRVAVWMNEGSGGFRPGATVETAAAGHALVAADFDGDGRVDLAVSSGEQGRVTMLYRQPEGGWRMETLAAGARAWGLAAADFNGDGLPELAVGRGEAGLVMLNPRGGASVEVAVEGGARSLAAADFDGDGKVDLAVAGSELRLLLNEGEGRFFVGPAIPAGGVDLRAVIAADFTGDGLPDLVVPLGRTGAVAMLASAGRGRFASPELYAAGALPYAVAAADFDGDGRMDVAVVTERGVATLVHAGRTVSRSAVRSAVPSSVALAASPSPSTYGQAVTLTATVTAGATGKVTFYDGVAWLGTATISGGSASFTTRSLAAGARSLQAIYPGDAVYGKSTNRISHSVSVVSNNGFRQPVYVGILKNPVEIIVADFNGDGNMDMAAISIPGTVTVALGNGSGSFSAPTLDEALALDPKVLVAGDFNGDGKTDLAIGYGSGNQRIDIRLGRGDGTFQAGVPVNLVAWRLVVADFNLDGKSDLAVLNQDGASLLTARGDGTFNIFSVLSTTFGEAIGAGDLNADGSPDLIVGAWGQIRVMKGNGDGTFQALAVYNCNHSSTWLVVEDFDRDGRNDVASLNFYSIDVFRGNGDGTLQAVQESWGGGDTHTASVADLDGDGKPDVAVPYNAYQGLVNFYLSKGDGTFDFRSSFLAPPYSSAIAAADFNGDGRPDVLVGGTDSRGIAILLAGTPVGLAIEKTHSGNFTAGETGRTYRISVSNPNFASSSGWPTVVDSVTPGLTITAMSGEGWSCSLASHTCTRTGSPPSFRIYDDIFVTVNVSSSLQASTIFSTATVTDNSVTTSGTDAIRIVRPTSTTLTVSGSPATSGGPVTLIAAVSDGAQGTVSFADAAQWLGSATVSGGQAVLVIRSLREGTRSIRATYGGSQSHGASVSNTVPVAVRGGASTAFSSQVKYATPSSPRDIVTGDFNGDGKLDLVTASTTGNPIAVLLGNGDGTFAPAVAYFLGAEPVTNDSMRLTAADFNGDGRLDLAVLNRTRAMISILLGNGNGTFQPAREAASCKYPYQLLVSDFNLDGKADLAVPAAGDYSCAMLGNGDGTFQPFTTIAGRSNALITDLNEDGKPDITFLGGYPLTFYGGGDGTFTYRELVIPPDGTFAFVDWNGDGKQDAMHPLNGRITVSAGNGTQSFGPVLAQQSIPFYGGGRMILVDHNGDGRLDVISTHGSDRCISVLLSDSDGTLQPAISYSVGDLPNALVSGDFNGDGRVDVAVANEVSNNVSVLLGTHVPLLSIQITHRGNFAFGQKGAKYFITVSNSGPGATSGTVTVTEAVPSSLKLLSMSGSGWSCPFGGSTCTRSDVLNAGASYPVITAVVNIARYAYSPQVNAVSVSGGGAKGASASDTAPLSSVQLTKIGVYRNGSWFLDSNGNGWFENGIDATFSWWAGPGSIPVTGDWNGDGRTKVGFFKDGLWYLDHDGNGVWNGAVIDKLYGFGWAASGVTPIVGDWNGDGRSKVGVFYNGLWYLDYNGNGVWDGPVVDRVYGWGWAGVKPLVGDWDATGTDKIGFFINGYWYLDYDGNGIWDGGVADKIYGWGWDGVTPLIGDWNGDGRKKIGFFINGYWYLDYDGNGRWDGGTIDKFYSAGWSGVVPIVGDWSQAGPDRIGYFYNGVWYVDLYGQGTPQSQFALGQAGDVLFIAHW